MSELIRHDDLNALRGRRFRVPELFEQGAWLTVPVGQRSKSDLGPTSTQILLWLPVDAPALTWNAVENAIGGPRGATSRTALAAAMDALLPGNASLDRTIEGEHWIIRGREYPVDEFGSIFWKHGWALGTDAGLLVGLMNG